MDADEMTWEEGWMVETDGERRPWESMLSTQLDVDDDDISIYIYICVYMCVCVCECVCVCVFRSSFLKMNMATRVQILGDLDSISCTANTVGKDMNPIILPSAMCK